MSLQDKLWGSRSEKLKAEKEAGTKFLAENKTNSAVSEQPGGIQYEVLKEAVGKQPDRNSTIKAHYRGCLLNGKEFDSSFKRNQPFTARLTQLIKGWQEVIPMMKEGSTWRLWIPSDFAYGDNGTGGIPGGATLQFDVELIQVLD